MSLIVNHFLELSRFFLGLCQGWFPKLIQEFVNIFRLFGHVLFKNVMGMGLISQKIGPLHPQGSHLGCDFFVVIFVVIIAAVNVALVDFFPKIASLGILKKGDPAWFVKGNDPFAFMAALCGRFGGSSDDIFGQTGQIFFTFKDNVKVIVLLEDVVTELERQQG